MVCAPSEDSDQPGHPPSLIRVFSVHMRKAESTAKPLMRLGGCPGWSESSLGTKVILLVLSCLTYVNNTDFCYFEAFYFPKLSEKARVFIYPSNCMSPFIMSYCRRVVMLTFIFHDSLRVSLFIQPSSRPKRRRKGGIFDGERLRGHL